MQAKHLVAFNTCTNNLSTLMMMLDINQTEHLKYMKK